MRGLVFAVLLMPIATSVSAQTPMQKHLAAFDAYNAAFKTFTMCLQGRIDDVSNRKEARDCSELEAAWKKARSEVETTRKKMN